MPKFLFYLALVLFTASQLAGFYAKKLPDSSLISKSLIPPPIQQETEEENFSFKYYDKKYLVKPLADYEISGMVVSHNDIHSWFDMYHDKSSVDIKDLCVLWGTNTRNNLFKDFKFESGAWTCYFSTSNNEAYEKFFQDEISNNHLISADPKIRDLIQSARIGDQIKMKGHLVSYTSEDNPQGWRSSSLVREDTGNGACEVMYVKDFRFLKRNNPGLYSAKNLLKWLSLIALFASIALFLRKTYRR